MRKDQQHRYRSFSFGILLLAVGCFALSTLNSCKKWIEVEQSGSTLQTGNVFADSVTVESTLAALYLNSLYRVSTSTLPGFSADEFQYVGTNYDAYINNSLLSTDGNLNTIWNNSYSNIYYANSIIEGLVGSQHISERFRNQGLAEARFMRAYGYFYLINLFGDVPLILSTEVNQNSTMGRTPVADVYEQILADLKFAQSILPEDYSISAGARTRVNKWVATAMLAKVYLYLGHWEEAEAEATAILDHTALFNLETDLSKVFTPTSREAIWQFYNDATGYTQFAYTVSPNATSKVPTYVLTPSLTDAFEAGDTRQSNWTATLVYNGVDYTYPTKYKSVVMGANEEYYTPLRLAELFLIRAEARAQQQDISGAQTDVSVIRHRAGLGNTAATEQASLLLAIEQERRIELNGEGGNRWFDLKRTDRVDAVIGALKSAFWKPTAALYPIPLPQITANAHLTQNPGYN